jgi:hypothetical protein
MDDLKKDIKEIRESQIRMESDLKYHIRRTDLLEKDVNLRAAALKAEVDKIDRNVIELSKPMAFADIMKVAGAVAAVVSSTLLVIKYFKGL